MARRESWVPDGAAEGAGAYGDDAYDDGYPDRGGYDDYYDADSALSAGVLVRTLRALSGAVAAGLALLAVAVVVVAIIGGQRGFPGPGTMSVAVHVAGAVAALICQRFADRRRDAVAALASLGVFAITGAVLWTQWWN